MSNDQHKLLAWAEEQAFYKDGFTAKHYTPEVCHHMNTLDRRVRGDCVCKWVAPYGFVPEADCPEHDKGSMTDE